MGPDATHDGQPKGTWPPNEAGFPKLISIPEHELLGCIGRGSYGQVWLARNAMGAYRAVKIVFRDSFDNERPFERELSGIQKFEPVSRLHDGFIDVLQVGRNERQGYFYYIMELADDQASGQKIDPATYAPNTLASEISRRGTLSLQECLQLGMALTHALADLHKHGLVHRDIKPSNVIFVDGVPKLADIGLVADVHDARSYVGTEGFIPPEGPGHAQGDIYSLGKVLYEASTGKDRHDFPEFPSHWSQSPDYEELLELNEVILQACKPDPRDRYQSAWDMHGDLVVVVNGKSVKRLRVLERRMAFFKRAAAVGLASALLLAVIIFEVYREWQMAGEEHRRQVNANLTYGTRAMDDGDLFAALPYFAEALRLDQGNRPAERNHRLRLGSMLARCPKLTQMWFEPRDVIQARFSPDGQRVLLAQYFGDAELHDVQTGRLIGHPFGAQPGLRSASFSPDGQFILTTSESSTALVWDTASLSQVLSLPHTNKVYGGGFSPDGQRIVTACSDGIARIWNARTGQLQFSLPPYANLVSSAGFSHNGRLIVTASHDGTARIWNADDGRPVTPALVHPMWVNWVSFSPDDKRIVTACDDHKARVWDVASGVRLLPDLNHADAVESAEFSPDGRLILTAAFDGAVRLWRAEDFQPLPADPFLQHGERVRHATFGPDGRQILTACIDGSVRVWDLAGGGVPPGVRRAIFSADGTRFATTAKAGLVVHDALSGHALASVIEAPAGLDQAQLTFSGAFLLTSSLQMGAGQTNRVVQAWETDTGKPLGPGIVVSAPFTGAVLSDDGRRAAIYGGRQARVWDVRTGTPENAPLVHERELNSALFNPSGSILVTVSDTNVYVWNAQSGRLTYPRLEQPVGVVYTSFSRDGTVLVTCCSDMGLTRCFAQLWDVQTGRPIGEPLRHGDGVLRACFDRNGARVATASEDFTAKVWDVKSGRQIGLPLRHAGQVWAAAFSPGGEWLATASSDRTARVWDPVSGDPISPPLRHLVPLRDVLFLPGDGDVVTFDRQGHMFEWRLPVDNRPVPDLTELTEFLSGGNFISPVNPGKRKQESPAIVWQRLRSRYPGDFAVANDAIVRWHEFQAEESEFEQQWAAAVFHLECLSKLRVDDAMLRGQLSRAKQHLVNTN